MGDTESLEADLQTAEKAAAEAWEDWKTAAPQAQDTFLKRYNDIQGGVESLRQQISLLGASSSPLRCLRLFFVCKLAATAASLGKQG